MQNLLILIDMNRAEVSVRKSDAEPSDVLGA